LSTYLTTDELVEKLNKVNLAVASHGNIEKNRKNDAIIKKQTKPNKEQSKTSKKTKRLIFFIVLGIALLNLIFLMIPTFFENGSYFINGDKSVLAVPNDQEFGTGDNVLITKLIVIERLDPSTLEDGTLIVVYGKFNRDLYWMEEVLDFDLENETINTTFAGFILNTYSFDEVDGIYVRDANLMNTIYYVSTSVRGFIILVFIHLIIFGFVYYFFIRDKKLQLNLFK
jgi:hypothetical protein